MKKNPDMKQDMYRCAVYYASPIFFLTLFFIVLLCISFYYRRKYLSKKATITAVEIIIISSKTSFTLFSTRPPSQKDVSYRYNIRYEHDGKTYFKVIEHTRAMNIGDSIDVVIVKKNPQQFRSSEVGIDDFFYPFLIISLYFGFRSIILMLMLMTDMGKFYICSNGIVGSLFGTSYNTTKISSSNDSLF